MSFLKGIRILFQKEIKEIFSSSMIYLFTSIFSLILGTIFYTNLIQIKQITNYNILTSILAPAYSSMNILLLFMIPLLTMESFVKEKRNNTLSLLQNSKLTNTQIYISKYLSYLLQGLFLIFPSFLFPIILSLAGFDEWKIMMTNYIGIIGLLTAYLSVGIFSSILSKNSIISVVLSFGILFSLMILNTTGHIVSNQILGEIIRYISLAGHVVYFTKGAIVSSDIFYFISFLFFFSYMSIKILGIKR